MMPRDHEHLVVRSGHRSRVPIVVAIHSTALGPALGGVRIWSYERAADGVRDALRLSQGMTLKAAAAGLDLGGGKAVICAPAGGLDESALRRAALLDFGDVVEELDGEYITAEDVGVTPQDLCVVAERTSHVTGLPAEHGGSGDPSPFTAMGVEAAMRACCAQRFGTPDLAGRRFAVIGLGHVGAHLAGRLARAGGELVVTDIDDAKRALAAELGAEWVEPDAALEVGCDVLAPCALGGTISEETIDALDCAIVCGSANNQLVRDSLADALREREILYAPDFIANAGGLIHVAREVHAYDSDRAMELVAGIESAMDRVLATAARRGITPLAAAHEVAAERLARAEGRAPAYAAA